MLKLYADAFGVGGAATGTTIKFSPLVGTDSVMKNGATQTINIKHHCITCMREYDSKSLEELRFEDYLANRKGPSQVSIKESIMFFEQSLIIISVNFNVIMFSFRVRKLVLDFSVAPLHRPYSVQIRVLRTPLPAIYLVLVVC